MGVNFTPEQKEYINITPFKLFVIEQFPFIEADFDSITNWQLLQKLGQKINEIISNMKNVTDNTTALYNAYNELQQYVNDYFDNLDVQDEINNKLDELVNDGTFSKLLEPYLTQIQNSILELQNNKRDKNVLITMNDLSQEVKEAFTGGSVAIVGKKSVNNVNVQDFSLAPSNMNFINSINNNLLDLSLVSEKYYNNSGVQQTGKYVASDFIDVGDVVLNETTFKTNATNSGWVLFNKDKEFIELNGSKPLVITNENVKYIQLNILKTDPDYNNLYILKNNNTNIIINKLNLPNMSNNNSFFVPTDNLIGNTIKPENVNFINHVTNNLFNKNLCDRNGYFSNSGIYRRNDVEGNLSNYGSYIMNVPTYIKNETVFYQGVGIGFINFFNNKFEWLGNLETPNARTFTIPYDDVTYMTKSLLLDNIDNYYIILGTSDLIDYYELNNNIRLPNINTNSILKDKKIGFLGDSITYGLGVAKPYPTVIQENTGCISTNYGISGNSIAKAGENGQQNAQKRPMCVRYSEMSNDLDYILVFGGTNDYQYQIPIGESDSTDITTFYGGLNTLITGLIEKYPGKPMLFLTPLYRSLNNESGYKFMDYVNAIKERCAYYSIPYFNLTDRSTIKSLINTINDMYYVNRDRLHPNEEGQKIIARIIQHQLEII